MTQSITNQELNKTENKLESTYIEVDKNPKESQKGSTYDSDMVYMMSKMGD